MDKLRAQALSSQPKIIPLPDDDERDNGDDSDDSDKKSKMSFSYWGADKVTVQKPVLKGRAVVATRRGGGVASYGRESSANAKFGTRLVSDGSTHTRPASRRVQSVSGGGHWGGGLWASTRDHARFGLLMLRGGQWQDRQLLSPEWMRLATTPVGIRPNYGALWWLNTNRAQYRSASPESFFALGAGGNVIWIDPANDVVAVIRWTDTRQIDEFIRLVTAAVR